MKTPFLPALPLAVVTALAVLAAGCRVDPPPTSFTVAVKSKDFYGYHYQEIRVTGRDGNEYRFHADKDAGYVHFNRIRVGATVVIVADHKGYILDVRED